MTTKEDILNPENGKVELAPRLLINLNNLSQIYENNGSKLKVLNNVTLKVFEGEFVSILGRSGCGKTTLLKIIGGLLKKTEGKISVCSEDPDMARKNRKFGFVFQKPVLFNWRNVLQNVLLPFEINNKGRKHKRKSDRKDLLNKAYKMVHLVGLKGFENSFPNQLSGGMQSRVSIARALIFEPQILLMDEPFGDLDEITRTRMNLELLRLWKSTNSTILFVTHSVQEAIFLSDRVIVLSSRPGEIVMEQTIDFPRPRDVNIINSNEFTEYAKLLREAIGMQYQ